MDARLFAVTTGGSSKRPRQRISNLWRERKLATQEKQKAERAITSPQNIEGQNATQQTIERPRVNEGSAGPVRAESVFDSESSHPPRAPIEAGFLELEGEAWLEVSLITFSSIRYFTRKGHVLANSGHLEAPCMCSRLLAFRTWSFVANSDSDFYRCRLRDWATSRTTYNLSTTQRRSHRSTTSLPAQKQRAPPWTSRLKSKMRKPSILKIPSASFTATRTLASNARYGAQVFMCLGPSIARLTC